MVVTFQGLSVAIETVRIIKELVEIWPNEVCDTVLCGAMPIISYSRTFCDYRSVAMVLCA